MANSILLGIDAGGTFTDFIAIDLRAAPIVTFHKTLSTPDAPERAILSGIAALGLDRLEQGVSLHIIHGSTVATNALLEGKLARTAFVTNHGLGDLLSLARQTRPSLYALDVPPQPEPVPAELCLEIGGRLAADGAVVEGLDEAQIRGLLDQLRELRPDAVAINLLFSFLDPRFEQTVAAAIETEMPTVLVSQSAEVLPVYREYERGIATWLNAALGPAVQGYLRRLHEQLHDVPLQIMQSNGETMAAEQAGRSAAHLLLSGPAGGLAALEFLGRQAGEQQLISFDMGGTSTDVSLMSQGRAISTSGQIAGYPIALPMVDMQTIGAGGGSIATVDSGGMLQVGPQSAGADPGPACYGRGGEQATVTDANLVLGRLLPDAKLAGELQVQPKLAEVALARLADSAGLTVLEAARGVIRIANEHMARAIRMISVNRGHRPQDFLLVSFGGAGGLHVCELASALNMNRAMVPVHGGLLSALGMVVADRGRQYTKTVNLPLAAAAEAKIEQLLGLLQAQGIKELESEGVPADSVNSRPSADLRYRGQSFTLNVPWQSAAQAGSAFAALHTERNGYRLDVPVEVVNLRVDVFSPQQEFSLPRVADVQTELPGYTTVAELADPVPVFQRERLPVQQRLSGPAVVVEYAATTFVAPGWTVIRDPLGNLHLSRL